MTEPEHPQSETESEHVAFSVEAEPRRSNGLEFDRFLLEHAPVNSGTKALIFKVEAEEIPEEVREKYSQIGSKNSNAALKVLKVYSRGKGQAEFDAQTRAYQMVEEARRKGQDVALVPTPLEWQEVRIEDETKEVLNNEGGQLHSNEAELLVMDFVEGEDLATVFYKWIVEHAPVDKQHIVQNVSPHNFEDLQRAVAEILDFIKPGGRSFNEAARAGEEKRATNMNAEKTYRFLRKTGFRINPKIITQIKNTFRVFKENSFYHNDDHERNFMVTGDYSGNGEAQAYVVDFDKAGDLAEGQSGDFRIDNLLAQLVEDSEDPNEVLSSQLEAKLSNPEWVKRMAGFFEAENPQALHQSLLRNSLTAASSEAGFEDFVAVIRKLSQEGRMTQAEAVQVLDRVRESLVVNGGKKSPTRIISPSIYNKAGKYKELFNQNENHQS